jgi:hypothetical protein
VYTLIIWWFFSSMDQVPKQQHYQMATQEDCTRAQKEIRESLKAQTTQYSAFRILAFCQPVPEEPEPRSPRDTRRELPK